MNRIRLLRLVSCKIYAGFVGRGGVLVQAGEAISPLSTFIAVFLEGATTQGRPLQF
jgi:hypothetical protein